MHRNQRPLVPVLGVQRLEELILLFRPWLLCQRRIQNAGPPLATLFSGSAAHLGGDQAPVVCAEPVHGGQQKIVFVLGPHRFPVGRGLPVTVFGGRRGRQGGAGGTKHGSRK